MSLKRNIVAAISLSLLGAGTACASDKTHTETKKTVSENVVSDKTFSAKPAAEYVVKTAKPGAAVSFSSDYDGKARAGETRLLGITLSDRYPAGTLTVRVSGTDGLILGKSSQTYSFNMAGDTTHSVPVTVKALYDGQHSVNVLAIAEFDGNQVARSSFSIPYNVGVVIEKSSGRTNAAVTQTAKGEPGIIAMDAEETILSGDNK